MTRSFSFLLLIVTQFREYSCTFIKQELERFEVQSTLQFYILNIYKKQQVVIGTCRLQYNFYIRHFST